MKNLLIVDRCPQTRLVLKPLLEEQGYRPTFVADASAALAALWQEPFGAILIDTTDPASEGERLLETLRDCDPASRQKRLAFIELGAEDKRERLLQAGCAECLDKPINFHDLTMVLSEALR